MSKTIKLSRFKGINNIYTNIDGGLKWLVSAKNININNNGSISRRNGYSKIVDSNNIKFIFGDEKSTRLYYIENNKIYNLEKNLEIFNGLVGDKYSYSEYNDNIYLSDGIDLYIINTIDEVYKINFNKPNQVILSKNSSNSKLFSGSYKIVITHVIDIGNIKIETGASDPVEIYIEDGDNILISNIEQIQGQSTNIYIAPSNSTVYQFYKETILTNTNFNSDINILKKELNTFNLDTINLDVDKIDFNNNKLYTNYYNIDQDISVVNWSIPFSPHLFNLEKDFLQIKGKLTLLKSIKNNDNQFILLATENNIYIYEEPNDVNSSGKLTKLADYGVVNGTAVSINPYDSKYYFWTTNGLCNVLPFTNLSEDYVVPFENESSISSTILYDNNDIKFISSILVEE